jgi:opacity protein-like surface antigen
LRERGFPGGCPNNYVVGAGVEWAPWSTNWIVRAECLYQSGATAVSFFPPLVAVAANPVWNNVSTQSARVGLSYKFW